MNKSLITSISPRECELIARGRQTMLVRKTRPKIETPFKCYIYKSFGKRKDCFAREIQTYFNCGKVIGEFVCDKITRYESEFWDDDTYERIQEPWEPLDFAEYGEYEYDTIGINGEFYGAGLELSKQSCLSWNELRKYVGQGLKDFYGWHISDLKIYDKPKELGEFGNYKTEWVQWYHSDDKVFYPLTRPPQSWVYCEPIEEE